MDLRQLYRLLRQFPPSIYPELINQAPGKNVLVLSPHPDDDVIGCGGAIIRLRKANRRVTITYLTDGGYGKTTKERDQIIATRRTEAKEAARLMGDPNLIFWSIPGDRLATTAHAAKDLHDLIISVQPDTIYLPFMRDAHPDHRAANELLAEIELKMNPLICAYEVWSPLPANRVLDISNVAEQKRRAIQQHASQVAAVPYDEIALALNRYRSMTISQQATYAEAFFVLPHRDYCDLIRKLS